MWCRPPISGHVINLFAWRADTNDSAAPRVRQLQGFNVICWRADGTGYCAVSDVERDTLERCVKLVDRPG